MRRDVLGWLVLATLVATGCSRLAFVKPSASRGDYERVAPEITARETRDGAQRSASHHQLLRAQQSLDEGDLDAARDEATRALKLYPRSADAHTVLAVIAERRGQPAEAGGHYRRATELAPQSGAVLNNYGAWLCASGRTKEALPLFEQALADPAYRTPAAALANSGACAQRHGGLDDYADAQLRSAIAADPENAVALGALARQEFRAGRYLQARAFSERRLAAAPPDAQALLLASQIEQKLGDMAASARYGRRLRELFPDVGSANAGENTQ